MAGQESTHDVLCAVTHDLCLHSNSNQGILSPNLPCRINQCSDSDYLAKATFFSPKHICIWKATWPRKEKTTEISHQWLTSQGSNSQIWVIQNSQALGSSFTAFSGTLARNWMSNIAAKTQTGVLTQGTSHKPWLNTLCHNSGPKKSNFQTLT